jgi:hypothetical protein
MTQLASFLPKPESFIQAMLEDRMHLAVPQVQVQVLAQQ